MTSWDDGLDTVLRAVHARLGRDPSAKRVTVALTEQERGALAYFLGMSRTPDQVARVALDGPSGLAAAVAVASGRTLPEELVRRFGPLVDPGAARRAAREERQELWDWWLSRPELTSDAGLMLWAQNVRASGVRGSAPRTVLAQTLRVLDTLPAPDELLPVLAGRLLQDTHALDSDRQLSTLVLGALAAQQGIERPTGAAGRRALWRSVGVRDDELSSVVLVAGLRPRGSSTAAQACRAAADAGEVAALTLAQVRGGVGDWQVAVVHTVENPALLALAVDDFGADLPAMVCTSGWPSGAVTELLRQMAAEGARIRHHGDLDGDGLRIATHLADLVGAEPWRMSAVDYRAHLPSRGASAGRVTDVPWDADLGPMMRASGVAVLEENVWRDLASDLTAAGGGEVGT